MVEKDVKISLSILLFFFSGCMQPSRFLLDPSASGVGGRVMRRRIHRFSSASPLRRKKSAPLMSEKIQPRARNRRISRVARLGFRGRENSQLSKRLRHSIPSAAGLIIPWRRACFNKHE